MQHNYLRIEAVVTAVRRKRQTKRILFFALIGLAVLLASLLLSIALLPSLSGPLHLAGRIILLALFVAGLGGSLLLSFLRRETMESAARAIERVNPQLKNDLINSLQLMAATDKTGPASAFSREFLAAHLEKTATLLPELDVENAASTDPLKRPAMICIGLLGIFIILLLALPGRSRQGLAALFTAPWETTGAADQRVSLPLTTGDFILHYTFPAYTGLPPQTVPNTNGDLSGLKGTIVRLETRVLEPLERASVITSSGSRYTMTVEDNIRLAAQLVLSEPGTYRIEGVDLQGRARAENTFHHILLEEDLAPVITLLQPVGDMEMAVEDSLLLQYEAEDDFGLKEVWMVYKQAEKEERLLLQQISAGGEKFRRGEYEWVLSKMKFLPGDRIEYYLEVKDNDEVSGGNLGRSQMRILEIFSARKEHRKLLARQDELLNLMIDHLAAQILARPEADKPGTDLRPVERKLLSQGSELVSMIESLHQALSKDEYAEEMVVDALYEMQTRYFLRLAERSKIIALDKPLSAQERDQLITLWDEYQTELENDIIFLDRMIKKQRVADILSEMDDLQRAQEELAALLEKYRQTGDAALLEEIRRTMAELDEAWENLLARMAEMRAEMPEEFVNSDAFKNASLSDLGAMMEKLRQALADGDMEAALALAEELFSQMGRWTATMEDQANAFGTMISSELASKLRDFENQVDDVLKRQKEIEAGLRELYEKAMDRTAGEGQEGAELAGKDLEEMLRRFEEASAEAMRSFYQLRRGEMSGQPAPATPEFNDERRQISSGFSDVQREARSMVEEAGKKNLERAVEMGLDVLNDLDRLRNDLRAFADKHQAGPQSRRDELDEKQKEARQVMEEMVEYLQNLKFRLSLNLTPGEREQLENLKQIQKHTQENTELLREMFEELQAEIPSLPSECHNGLARASDKMGEAIGEMEQLDPGRAQLPAQEARTALEQVRQQLGKAKQKMQGMAGMMRPGCKNSQARTRGREGMEGRIADGEVKLPDENAYQVPEEFRQELLKAMKEGSPEAYKHLNRDYYERLVR